ncbi:HNH endonuclease [Paenibacillus taichungensis]|uniref:HNH endonuclease n=1 Tax=Paenibacillus taichungensis TaxID=484184 RepID=UPI00287110C0|nr:HNH endonuclease [Paenibacillus taichungensis]MDR9744404.1 HNH endonuclease [Paenibacillus taichungensis]
MEKIKIELFTSVKWFSIEINDIYSNDFLEFLKIFNHTIFHLTEEIEIYRIQKKNISMIEKLDLLIEKHKMPPLYKMKANLNQLKDDEYFIILINNNDLTQKEKLDIAREVDSLNGFPLEESHREAHDQFIQILNNYNIRAVNDERKIRLGEANKEIRKCRFCFKGKKDGVTFISEAHIISEALGNKTLIQNEECDQCNSRFEKTIEKHLIKYLDLYRTFFGVKNKENNVPKIKGKNFEFSKIDEKNLLIKHQISDGEEIDEHDFSKEISLRFHDQIIDQNIYKTLVKFAIGIMEPQDLQSLKQTIDWVRSDLFVDKVPKIGILSDYNLYSENPRIVAYVRKDGNTNLPYALGEFHFKFLTFVFVIPSFENNEKNFIDDNSYDAIWEAFRFFNVSGNMEFEDFSSSIEKDLQIKLKLCPNE